MENIYDVTLIAKWIINKIHPEPLKLQKLLYLAQGFSYAFHDKPLFKEDIEGWGHGPVVPVIYRMYSSYKYSPITINYDNILLDKDSEDVLNYVIDNYSKYDSKYLEKLTHDEEPWIDSRKGLDSKERSGKVIPKEAIANYFISDILQPDIEEWN